MSHFKYNVNSQTIFDIYFYWSLKLTKSLNLILHDQIFFGKFHVSNVFWIEFKFVKNP